jgi:beta-phosphoglucomutase-like phosphatase (HAD superfamily)
LAGLDLKPQECLVIENAPLGIRAAKLAGIPVVALTTTLPAADLAEADWILGGLEGLLEWFERHGILAGQERDEA